ncbi:lysosomal alpha-mannosidase-like [Galendromus occidentalis]|uniref:Alpha-mannosidase n=1 Tax=Galendromus occidentalis TaxID=34638 RepID=A0AAJ7SI24_9ACAR|nr:lysosomal alpha-mannosidase-like [Galendromus occidentalis]
MGVSRPLFCLVLTLVIARAKSRCVSCPPSSETTYNVHLIPHSHMDLGWLKTVEQYYYGTNAKVTPDAVQYIYDSVLKELSADEERRFIFVETGFFSMWWEKRPESRELFRELLERGQIEFISGGIVMNDEACTQYDNIIDQMSFGLNTLQRLFGTCGAVETGWQIDPFGHSKQYASILREMGFKQLFFGRIDYQEKKFRQETANMEFIWKFDDLKNITVSVTPDNYRAPPGFCFDIGCDDPVLVTDVDSEEYNVKERADIFVNWVRNNSKFYRTNNLLVTMGEDFNYMDAHKWFSNMDSLIEYINRNNYTVERDGEYLEMNLIYSTPTCYSRASAHQNYSVNRADFFPYAYPDEHSFWTGYFTSRPSFKYLVRWATGIYRAASQILSEIVQTGYLDSLRHSLAIAQHHDAITGTAKQFVNDNYVKLLSDGVQRAVKTLGAALGKQIEFCPQLNVSRCPLTEDLPPEGLPVVVYNPLAFNISTFLRFPLRDANVEVHDELGSIIKASVTTISDAVFNLAERQSSTRFELCIPVTIGALKFRHLRISPARSRRSPGRSAQKVRDGTSVVKAGDVEVGIGHGGIQWIRAKGKLTKIGQTFGYYQSTCSNGSRASGAYVFRPDGPKIAVVLRGEKQVNSDDFVEIRQTFSDNVYQNTRVYSSKAYVEADWIVGPINVSDNIGKEFVMTIRTDVVSNVTFFTDSNGRDVIERVRDFRENWNSKLSEPVSGNYYPITSRININDGDHHVTFLTDRARGGTSLQSGSIELMLHRRCLCDDRFGVNEALNESGVDGRGLQVRGTFRVFFGDAPSRAEDLQMTPPFVFFTEERFSGVGLLNVGPVEGKIHIVTFSCLDDRDYLLRIENISGESVRLDFPEFITQRYLRIREMDLAGLSAIAAIEDTVEIMSHEIKTFLVTL